MCGVKEHYIILFVSLFVRLFICLIACLFVCLVLFSFVSFLVSLLFDDRCSDKCQNLDEYFDNDRSFYECSKTRPFKYATIHITFLRPLWGMFRASAKLI